MRRAARLAALAVLLTVAGAAPSCAQTIAETLTHLRPRNGGVLGLMGYNVIPDGSSNALQFNRAEAQSTNSASLVSLSQFGFGFTWGESLPIYTEAYMGYARYDPRYLFSGGEQERRTGLRWNNLTTTLGVGYDFQIARNLYIRPILNASLGYVAPDTSLFAWFVGRRTGLDTSALADRHTNAYGLGGSLVLAYYDHRPTRDIDVELRYTNITLQTFGDTMPLVRGQSSSQTVYLWARLRWPTGVEAFGRPVRWVLESNTSYYFGDQAEALGYRWAIKVGGGLELDVGRQEFGALGLYVSRIRLVARYMFADQGVTGTSVGLGFSF